MRRIVLAALLIGGAAAAAVNIVETKQVTLRRGSSTVASHPSMDACRTDALARIKVDAATRTAGVSTYLCRDERLQLVATFSPDPAPPTCPPPPASSTRTQQCQAGPTGTWTQTSTSTVGPPPACTVTTAWAPSSPPAGACTTPPPPPPPTRDTLTHGQPFTITGSGYGTKARAAPLVFDDFDDCAASTAVAGKAAVVGRWETGSFSGGVTCSEHDGHNVARHQFTTSRYNASLYVDPAPTQTVFLDFWIRGVPIANPSRNWKSWRFYSASDSEVGNSVYYCLGGGVDLGPSWVWKDEVPPPREWLHYQVIQKPGFLRHYRNGKIDLSSNATSGVPTVAQVRIGHYWGTDGVDSCASNPGGNVYTDDVYVDTSIARVELRGANNKYAIQRATSWVNDGVVIVGNTRGFAAGESAQLVVYDAAGKPINGPQVTVQ